MEIIIRPKRYTYADIKNKKRGNAWILLKIACILYSNKAINIKYFALNLLSYLYKFRTITEKQIKALENIYINETILLENIKLDVDKLANLGQYECTLALNSLNTSLPKLIATISSENYADKGETKTQIVELATTNPFYDKLLTILYNEKAEYNVKSRNVANKILNDYHLIGKMTKHMEHVIETIIPKQDPINYIELPKKKQLLEAYLMTYDQESI